MICDTIFVRRNSYDNTSDIVDSANCHNSIRSFVNRTIFGQSSFLTWGMSSWRDDNVNSLLPY